MLESTSRSSTPWRRSSDRLALTPVTLPSTIGSTSCSRIGRPRVLTTHSLTGRRRGWDIDGRRNTWTEPIPTLSRSPKGCDGLLAIDDISQRGSDPVDAPSLPLSLSSPQWSKSSSTKTEPSRRRDCTPEISHQFHGPKNVMCAPRSSPGKQPAIGSFTPAANPTHPPPPGTQRLNHLKRHLLTRERLRSPVRTLKLIDRICPDTDSRKHECEVSRSS